MLPDFNGKPLQVSAKLAAAEAKLASLEGSQKSNMAALQSKDNHKKWLKF